jgi:hypothetical protein
MLAKVLTSATAPMRLPRLMALVLFFAVYLYSTCPADPLLLEPPAIDYRIIDQGGLRTIVTNWATLGNPSTEIIDPVTGLAALPLEFPGLSGIEYLYEASLWIGGIVGGDTLVSTGTYSYWVRRELYPDTGAAGLMVFDDYYADEAYSAAYADTFVDINVVLPDRTDGPHRPLQIAVRQECRGWADEPFRDMMWVKIVIRNLGDQPIENAFVGWHADPDIGHRSNRQAYADDLAGFKQGMAVFNGEAFPYGAVYAIDNDGDGDSLNGFSAASPTGALGLTLASSSPPATVQSFNWWINSLGLGLDWGPYRPAQNPDLTAAPGRPDSDIKRYRMISNGEIDYDQAFAAMDLTAEGWGPPPDTAIFAAGHDTRFVYSVGPYELVPGDSVILDFVWFAGAGVHTDPRHFASSFSFEHPAAYLAGLDFTPWETTLAAALALEQSGFAAAAPGPPPESRLRQWTTDQATIGWQPKRTFDLAGYEIFRREIAEAYADDPLFTVSANDSSFTDAGLNRDEYAYAVRSFDIEGRRGALSPDIKVNLRRPMPVHLSNVIPGRDEMRIFWDPSPYPDIAAYHVKRLQETALGETTSVDIGWTAQESFVDDNPQETVKYLYAVTAESAGGLLSELSNLAPGMVMAFDGGPLILDQTLADESGLTDKDSVRSFWQRALPGGVYRNEDRALPATMKLQDFNHHPMTIVVSSGNFSETAAIHELLRDYCLAGGAILFVGRDLFNLDDLACGYRHFGPGDFAFDYLGVTDIFYPATMLSHPTQLNAEFIAALACHPDFPDLAADPNKTAWGIPEQLQPVGPAIPFVGWLAGDPDRTRCIYTYESLFSDVSPSQAHDVGLLYNDGKRRAGVFNFPLSMMEEPAAIEALQAMLGLLGEPFPPVPGDFDGNGQVNILDAVKLITWVFRNGPPPADVRAADVNGDCAINLIDVVRLIDYIFRGGLPPVAGCR